MAKGAAQKTTRGAKAAAARKPVMKMKAKAGLPLKGVSKKAPGGLRTFEAAVINLKARPDRWERISKSLKARLPWLPASRLDAVDGRVAPPKDSDVTRKWSTKRVAEVCHWYRVKTLTMSPGERGCCGSHVACWRRCARSGRPLIVLEDDAVILPGFAETLRRAVAELPKEGVDTMWLCSKDRGTAKRVGAVLMQPDYVWTTVGYAIWPSGARKLLARLPVDQPVDNFMAYLIRAGDLSCYSVRPGVVRQAQTWNVGSDVPHSDDLAHD